LKRRFFYKLFFIFLLILISSGFFINAILFYMNRNIYTLQLDNSSKAFAEQAASEIDKSIDIAFGIVNQIKNSKEVIEYLKGRSVNYYNITIVNKQLSSYLDAFSSIGCTIGLLKENENIVIWPKGTENIDYYFSSSGLSKSQIDKIQTFIKESKRYSTFVTVPETTETDKINFNKDLLVIKKEEVAESTNVVFFVRFFKDFMIPQMSNDSFFLIVKDNIILTSNYKTHKFPISNLTENDLLYIISPNQNLASKLTKSIDNYNFTIYRVPSKSTNLANISYYYVISDIYIKQKINRIMISSIITMLLVFILAIVVAFFISSKVYKPINQIVNKFKRYSIYQEKDEFAYLSQTLMEIHAEKEKLIEIVNNNQQNARKRDLLDILNGLKVKNEIDNIVDLYHLQNFRGPLAVIALEIVNYSDMEHQFTKENLLFIKSKASISLLKEIQDFFECELIEINHKTYAIIINNPNFYKILDVLEQAFFKIESDTGMHIVAAIGQQVDDFYSLERSFHNALSLLECRFAYNIKSIITQKDYDSLHIQNYFYPLDVEKQLITYIAENKKEDAEIILKRILTENFERRNLNKETISQFIFALVATINRLMKFINKKLEDFFEKDRVIYLELKMCQNTQQLKKLIEEIFATIISNVAVGNKEVDESIAKTILDYIHNNFSRDISLGEIASELKISVSYASILFKNKYSKNFKEYLNYFRIQKAKQLLFFNKDIKVKDLSEMVGFTNVNTFIRVFKSIENISPGEYLKRV